ncbi:hypothetical protein [Burkholderia ambifaria]|nr:hypothetical protein [Burkholderia ambifaria]MBR8347992.1 hypothetical protein [Burkholderia ambifaria]
MTDARADAATGGPPHARVSVSIIFSTARIIFKAAMARDSRRSGGGF